MGILAPTATVTAVVPTPNVAATAPTVTLAPEKSRDNNYVLITIVVTNPSDSENVSEVLVKDVSSGVSGYFGYDTLEARGRMVFGENLTENIDNLAEGLENAGREIAFVAENLREALVNLRAAGTGFQSAAQQLDNAGASIKAAGGDNMVDAGTRMQDAAVNLSEAASALDNDPIDLGRVATLLASTGTNLGLSSENLKYNVSSDENALITGGEFIGAAGDALDNFIDNAIRGAAFYVVSENQGLIEDESALDNYGGLEFLSTALWEAAWWFSQDSRATMIAAANYLENAAIYIGSEDNYAAENFRAASDNIVETGYQLSFVENLLKDISENFPLVTGADEVDTTEFVRFFSATFLEDIRIASAVMDNQFDPEGGGEQIDNILSAGSGLDNAVENQGIWLGTTLASNIIGYKGEVVKTTVRHWLAVAADSLKNDENLSLTAAASAFDNAGTKLTAASDNIKLITTGDNAITPTAGWYGVAQGDYSCRLVATNLENHIVPGASQTFRFLWLAPDIGTSENHTIRVWTKRPSDNAPLSQTDFTISMDGEVANLESIKVTQTGVEDYMGVAVDNLVGQVYDNAKATITMVWSEVISAFGTMRIENYKQLDDNLVLTISDFTTTDSKTFTYDFYTTDWDENFENMAMEEGNGSRLIIEGPSTTDEFGNENETAVYCYFEVDMHRPLIEDNGLSAFQALWDMEKPGTDNSYYVTTVKNWQIKGTAWDNENRESAYGHSDNVYWAITTVKVNDNALTMLRLDNGDFSVTENLVEGVNSVNVEVKDRVGLTLQHENRLDNIYVDNTAPTVAAVTVAGLTWTDNSTKTNDNKPTIRLKIQDTGWGIPWEDNCLQVILDNDDDISNGYIDNLENNGVWDNGVASGDYNWENVYDNSSYGLEGGTYYIIVEVSDNLRDNENWVQAFVLEITAPAAPASVVGSETAGSTAASKEVIKTTAVTLSGTAEAGATILVEKTTTGGTSWESMENVTVADDGTWSADLTVSEGVTTGIRVKCKDSAGNVSTATTWGYVMADATSPTVTITPPATSTEDASITVTGTVTKDSWETFDDLTLFIQVGTSAVSVPIIPPATGNTGTFSTSVGLSVGANTIIATVTDTVNPTDADSVSVTRTTAAAAPSPQATEYASYAIILVIVALILAAIAIFRKR